MTCVFREIEIDNGQREIFESFEDVVDCNPISLETNDDLARICEENKAKLVNKIKSDTCKMIFKESKDPAFRKKCQKEILENPEFLKKMEIMMEKIDVKIFQILRSDEIRFWETNHMYIP